VLDVDTASIAVLDVDTASIAVLDVDTASIAVLDADKACRPKIVEKRLPLRRVDAFGRQREAEVCRITSD
jgi:hypothetical protein